MANPRDTKTPPHRNSAEEAPELHNAEQESDHEQAQDLAEEAQQGARTEASPLDSEKDDNDSGLMDDSTQDLIDHMRDMEQSGRIDMGAYRGEPNLDDNEDKYDKSNRVDRLPSDGS